MVHEIPRDQLTVEHLLETLSLAGFEAEIHDDELFIRGTGCGVRLALHDINGVVLIRALFMLNPHASDSAAEALSVSLNRRMLVSKFVIHRWDDGDLGLFISYAVHYNFGLNVPNLLFILRRFIESCQAIYRNDIDGTRFDPEFKPPELELVEPAEQGAPVDSAAASES